MKNEFLTRLFWEVSAEEGQPTAARRISRLYERMPVTTAAWDPVNNLLSDMDGEKLNAFENAVTVLTEAFERQGFINGFRMGMMLSGELEGGQRHDGQSDAPAGIHS